SDQPFERTAVARYQPHFLDELIARLRTVRGVPDRVSRELGKLLVTVPELEQLIGLVAGKVEGRRSVRRRADQLRETQLRGELETGDISGAMHGLLKAHPRVVWA